MCMPKPLRFILQLLGVAFAGYILYPHTQHIWGQRHLGWTTAINQEFEGAWEPMIAAIAVLVFVIITGILSLKHEDKDQRIRDMIQEAMAQKLGVDVEAIKASQQKKKGRQGECGNRHLEG